jgi:hypothetical protein
MAADTQACPDAVVVADDQPDATVAQRDPPVHTTANDEEIERDRAMMLRIEGLLGTAIEWRPEVVSFMHRLRKYYDPNALRDYNVINGTSVTTVEEALLHATSTSDDKCLRALSVVLGLDLAYDRLKALSSTLDQSEMDLESYQREAAFFAACECFIETTPSTHAHLVELTYCLRTCHDYLRSYCHTFRLPMPLDAEGVIMDSVSQRDPARLKYLLDATSLPSEQIAPHLKPKERE